MLRATSRAALTSAWSPIPLFTRHFATSPTHPCTRLGFSGGTHVPLHTVTHFNSRTYRSTYLVACAGANANANADENASGEPGWQAGQQVGEVEMEVAFKDGWFREFGSMWPGQAMSIKVSEVLLQARSDFQDVCVFESESYGTVLLLDGVIQVTDRDEFAYQEMITHLPMCALKQPAKRALVVGGGDGGVLRELARYPSLEQIDIAEIDRMVPEVSQKYFPQLAAGFSDPRVKLHICDGIKFVEKAEPCSYDVIIVDSSDPVGPAEVLFEKPFFEALHRAVRPGGVVCTQAECLWLHLDIIRSLASMCQGVFEGGSVSYSVTHMPTYPSGQIGMMLLSKAIPGEDALDPRTPKQQVAGEVGAPASVTDLKYYSPEVHSASFVLPRFAQTALTGYLTYQ